ncbi:phosphotransferase [Salinisphaera sp.]|uniref:phosphotransferase n=1 Tax=Salinisphaera sp. TaxID=1914330 RepID=UPI002D780D4B|nr:phosphotransferase [Salinisphaera sp.]HET7313721.1 phosphotransferase [Salinisphaera sp.]
MATLGALPEIVESVLDARIDEFQWLGHDDRLYSAVYPLNVVIDGQTRPLVVKTWSNDATYRVQIDALFEARRVFAGGDGVNIPFVACDAQSRMLVMERVPDPSIESLAHCESSLRGLNFHRWKRRLEQACFSAGQWLRRWHTHNAHDARIDDLLGQYVEDRHAQLDLLPPNERRALLDLVSGLGRGPVAAVHGDFTPWNVLWSPDRLTMLDFGVNGWPHMTPAWDFCTMKTGLATELLFATRSPARWLKRLARGPISAFEHGYGRIDCEPAALDACAVVRHLNLYAADIESGPALRKRAAWHRASIRKLLTPHTQHDSRPSSSDGLAHGAGTPR